MTIEQIEVRKCRLPLVSPFETSFGRSVERTFLLVRVEGDGESGWGECVAEAHPYYSSETTDTAWHIITDYVAPLVLGAAFDHPRDLFPALARIRGHHMAKAAVEMAAWDLYARLQGQPLARVLGGSRDRIPSGVSIGIQASPAQLLDKIAQERAAGYQRIKIKIKPGWDVPIVAAVRERFGDIPLMVDANAAYDLDDAGHLAELDRFGLLMIEQPLDYDDVANHAMLIERVRTPICLDESIHSVRLGEDAIARRACHIINIKPGRVGGHRESIRLHDLCAASSIPVWHGGMLESGIGRAHNVALASLPNFSLPGDIAASKRYYAPDLIEPAIDLEPDGTVAVPTGPGIGVQVVDARVERATERKVLLTTETRARA